MAISISIPEAASQLAELLERVKHGEEVTILEAGVDRTTGSSTQTAITRIPGQDQGLSSSPLTFSLTRRHPQHFLNPGSP